MIFTQGFNATIFAYGQSGSGKTFSMLGPDDVVDAIKEGAASVPEKVLVFIANIKSNLDIYSHGENRKTS